MIKFIDQLIKEAKEYKNTEYASGCIDNAQIIKDEIIERSKECSSYLDPYDCPIKQSHCPTKPCKLLTIIS